MFSLKRPLIWRFVTWFGAFLMMQIHNPISFPLTLRIFPTDNLCFSWGKHIFRQSSVVFMRHLTMDPIKLLHFTFFRKRTLSLWVLLEPTGQMPNQIPTSNSLFPFLKCRNFQNHSQTFDISENKNRILTAKLLFSFVVSTENSHKFNATVYLCDSLETKCAKF